MDYGSCHSHDECCGTLATAECAACIPGYSKIFNSVCDLHGINAKKCFHLKTEMPQYETVLDNTTQSLFIVTYPMHIQFCQIHMF